MICDACGSTVGVSGIVIKRNFGNGNVSGLRQNQHHGERQAPEKSFSQEL